MNESIDITLELARLQRDAEQAVRNRMAARQLGLDFQALTNHLPHQQQAADFGCAIESTR